MQSFIAQQNDPVKRPPEIVPIPERKENPQPDPPYIKPEKDPRIPNTPPEVKPEKPIPEINPEER